jgi:4-hydroxythreonine-4-phosphate dehydrogenase
VRKLAVTLGDPAGIGPEVTLRALAEFRVKDVVPVIVGRRNVLEQKFSEFLTFPLLSCDTPESFTLCEDGHVYIHDIRSDAPLPDPGMGSLDTARESLSYVDEAVRLWKKGLVDAVVTGPVHKGLIEKSGTPFMGHTEYIAAMIGEDKPYMMMYSKELRVILVTTHVPLSDLPALVTEDSILGTIRTGDKALTLIDGHRPKIAVAGFDPHCGDAGAIGDFDDTITTRAIKRAREDGIDVHGPFSADTLFIPSRWKSFDLAVALYHDQGLIPFKILAFESGVNVTLGLSIVRTSVDHGTAFDIAGRGRASFASMTEALSLAGRLIEIRAKNA